ncbi:hypothetical protein AB1N83_009397, partial [Pleurotus pulmonarius]
PLRLLRQHLLLHPNH